MQADPIEPQPSPTGQGREVLPLVLEDLRQKSAKVTAKYGTPLRTRNGRKALVDAYQELLDLLMYLRQQLEEDREQDAAAAARVRTVALLEAVSLAEGMLHAEPLDQASELHRVATYSNGTLRRLIAQLRALLGQRPPTPAPAGPRKQKHRWRRAEGDGVFRCAQCPMEKHFDRGPQHGIVLVFKRDGQELARGSIPTVRVPPCRSATTPPAHPEEKKTNG